MRGYEDDFELLSLILEAHICVSFLLSHQIPDINHLIRREGLFWLTGCRGFSPWLLDSVVFGPVHHGGEHAVEKAAYLMVAERQRRSQGGVWVPISRSGPWPPMG